jgi:hypothetical protein
MYSKDGQQNDTQTNKQINSRRPNIKQDLAKRTRKNVRTEHKKHEGRNIYMQLVVVSINNNATNVQGYYWHKFTKQFLCRTRLLQIISRWFTQTKRSVQNCIIFTPLTERIATQQGTQKRENITVNRYHLTLTSTHTKEKRVNEGQI